MVTDNHYRWDFIQLADDPKPTPTTSPKVANGSTLYTSDDSKLYVWYENQWYEKLSTGGGGGGIPTTVIDTIWFGTQAQYDAIETKAEKTLYLVQEEITTANTLSASPAVLPLPKINLRSDNILDNIDNITPEEEPEEPEDTQVEETEVEEPEVEEQEVVEEPEEEETKESEE